MVRGEMSSKRFLLITTLNTTCKKMPGKWKRRQMSGRDIRMELIALDETRKHDLMNEENSTGSEI